MGCDLDSETFKSQPVSIGFIISHKLSAPRFLCSHYIKSDIPVAFDTLSFSLLANVLTPNKSGYIFTEMPKMQCPGLSLVSEVHPIVKC